jgi:transcription elongation factor GreA
MFLEDDPMWPDNNDGRHRGQPPPAWHPPADDQLPLTAAAHRALRQERDKLRKEKRHQFPARLRLVREFGDGSNNDEYLAIREEETVVDARLARLEDILNRALIVDPAESDGTVAIGCAVTVLDLGAGEPFDYVIDSAHAPIAPNAVSAVSPVGKALLGRSPGDLVIVELPRKGRTRELEILAVTPLSMP